MCLCYAPIVIDCLCAVILVSSVMLRMSSIFQFEIEKVPIPRKDPDRTQTLTQ